MSGLLSYLWSAGAGCAPASECAAAAESAAVTVEPLPACSSHSLSRRDSLSDEWVDVSREASVGDTPIVGTPAVELLSPGGFVAVSASATTPATPAPALPSFPPSSSESTGGTRACRQYGHAHNPPRHYGHAHCPPRPYGHAHNPPALLVTALPPPQPQAISLPAPTSSSPASSASSSSKRSFACVAASSPEADSDSAVPVPCYGQAAALSVAEALRTKIEELERESVLAAAADDVVLPSDDSPPVFKSTMRVPREQQLPRHSLPAWAVAVDEPLHSSKRVRATAAALKKPLGGGMLSQLKARTHAHARVLGKARGSIRAAKPSPASALTEDLD